ncbi:hypothetical protein [Streptosporangium sp. NPDC020145]|uniref:hypothetical protein n=1 Tax=Streptosporangium sp. NPDC020145 TaxID=3154694 RepID=UPI00343BFED1
MPIRSAAERGASVPVDIRHRSATKTIMSVLASNVASAPVRRHPHEKNLRIVIIDGWVPTSFETALLIIGRGCDLGVMHITWWFNANRYDHVRISKF